VCDRERDRKEREREREGEREGESQYIAMLAGIFCIDQTYLEVMILLLSLPKSWDLQACFTVLIFIIVILVNVKWNLTFI
jgi:hypothetical protein